MSVPKKWISLVSGTKISGCCARNLYIAVVPHFGAPTMKKSGFLISIEFMFPSSGLPLRFKNAFILSQGTGKLVGVLKADQGYKVCEGVFEATIVSIEYCWGAIVVSLLFLLTYLECRDHY